MGSLEMSGSYPLTAEAIDERLTRKSPGNYALGYLTATRSGVLRRTIPT
jgi:hypothetical protein